MDLPVRTVPHRIAKRAPPPEVAEELDEPTTTLSNGKRARSNAKLALPLTTRTASPRNSKNSAPTGNTPRTVTAELFAEWDASSQSHSVFHFESSDNNHSEREEDRECFARESPSHHYQLFFSHAA